MKIYYKTDTKLTATVLDEDGAAVLGATVTCTLVDLNGTVINGPSSMTSNGDGTYYYVVPDTISVSRNQRLVAQISASSGSWDAYTEVPVQVAVDRT